MHESVRIGGELWLIFHKLESKMFNNWEVVSASLEILVLELFLEDHCILKVINAIFSVVWKTMHVAMETYSFD